MMLAMKICCVYDEIFLIYSRQFLHSLIHLPMDSFYLPV